MKIVLTLMVRNEEKIVARALSSALPFVDAVVIQDNGSTDRTVEVATELMRRAGREFIVYRTDWLDFSCNRNDLLRVASEVYPGFYQLLLDADDQLCASFVRPADQLDAYFAEMAHGGVVYWLPKLINPASEPAWKGVTHEALYWNRPVRKARLPGFRYLVGEDSSRRLSGRKVVEDYELLRREVDRSPFGIISPRAVFYLAQSAEQLGKIEEAVKFYEMRQQMGGFAEEIYVSALRLGRILRRFVSGEGDSWKALYHQARVNLYTAVVLRPSRLEAVAELAEWLISEGELETARQMLVEALTYRESHPCDDVLFVEQDAEPKCRRLLQTTEKILSARK